MAIPDPPVSKYLSGFACTTAQLLGQPRPRLSQELLKRVISRSFLEKSMMFRPSIGAMVFNSVLFCRRHSSSTAVMLAPQPTSLPPLLSPIKASLPAAPLK